MIARADKRADGETVAAIVEQNRGLNPALVQEKYRRMRADLFAFLRGTNHLFARDWADLTPADPGPRIWACGDLHPKNFGCYRADDGSVVFDINDFDDAVLAPCTVDLIRCAAGIILAGEAWDHSPIRVMRMVLDYLEGYRLGLNALIHGEARPTPHDHARGILHRRTGHRKPVATLLADRATRTQHHLLDRLARPVAVGRLGLRRRVGRCYEVDGAVAESMGRAVEASLRERPGLADATVDDLLGRIAGVGSLGVRRFVALVRPAGDDPAVLPRLYDIKECTAPTFDDPRLDAPDRADSVGQARRIVFAQRLLQHRPTAGLGVLAVEGVGYRLRELIPEENRASLDEFRQRNSKLRRALHHAGWITAHAHLRGTHAGGAPEDELVAWADGPALAGVVASAVRSADRYHRYYKAFCKARLA